MIEVSRKAESRGLPNPAPSGFALLVVLLALLVLTGLVHGTLALARFHSYASLAEGRVVGARVAAQSGVRTVAADLPRDSLPVDRGALRRTLIPAKGTVVRVSVRQTAPEWLWIEGEARVGSGAGQAVHRTAAVYWSLVPAVRARDLSATVELGGEVLAASPEAITSPGTGSLDPGFLLGICDRDDALALRLGGDPVPAVDSLVNGEGSSAGDPPTLGLLGWPALAARRERGSNPGPDGSLRVIEGSFMVPEEGVRGVLVVSGDLEVPDARDFVGLALVGGSLTLGEEARLVGAARVRGDVTVRGEGRILGSRCTVHHVLRESPELSLPLAAPGGTWIRIP